MAGDDPTNGQGFESALVYALADELGDAVRAVQADVSKPADLDALAAGGTRLTQFYMAAPVCSPVSSWPASCCSCSNPSISATRLRPAVTAVR